MSNIKKTVLVFGLSILSLGGVLLTSAEPAAAAAAAAAKPITTASQCSQSFLTFPTWFRGLVEVKSGQCVITSPKTSADLSGFIWHIVLNVIEIGLQIVAYVAAGFILWGGFLFLTSQGSPDAAAKARKSILDAVIGFGISVASIAVINLLSGILIHNP